MRLPTSWRSVVRFWDSLFEAGHFGLARLLGRGTNKPFRFGTRPKKRADIPIGKMTTGGTLTS